MNEWVENSGKTRKEIADAAHCSVSTLKSLLNSAHAGHGFKKITLQKVCRAVGTALHQLERHPVGARTSNLHDFAKLAEIFAEIDSAIMPIIRGANADSTILSSAYHDLFELRASRQDIELKDICSRINTVGFWSDSFFQFPEPALTIQVSQALDSISYRVGSSSLTVRDPKLLRDCLCEDIDHPDGKCSIHSSAIGTQVLARFDSGISRVDFMNTFIWFRLEKSLWPPSMDSFIMATRLNEAGVFQRNSPRVLDLGSGTGFLGLLAMRLNQSVRLVHLSDWMLSPLFWGSFNWFQNRRNREYVEVKTILGRFGENIPDNAVHYDLCLCNPPYLPEHRSSPELNMRSAVYGTELLRYVISNHRRLARDVYVQFSKIAQADAENECEKAGARLLPIGEPTLLPFRPSYRKLNKDYLRFLEGRGLVMDQSKRYPYWHQIQLYVVKGR